LVGKPEGKRALGSSRNRWIIILLTQWMLGKYGGKVWTECIWLRTGTSGRLL